MMRTFENKVLKLAYIGTLTGLCLLWMLLSFSAAEEAPLPRGEGISLLEAVRMTLANDPNIRLQEKNVEISKGSLQQQTGQFDMKMQTSAGRSYEYTPLTEADAVSLGRSQLESDSTSVGVGMSKQFRSGISITPSIEVTQTDDPDDTAEATNYSTLGFTIQFPLLNGRGKGAPGASEKAARIAYEASELDLQHTVAERILNTVYAYWNCLAAKEQLEVLRKSESRAGQLVRDTGILIESGEVPAADIKHLQANLAVKAASRIAGEQTLFEAKHNLGLAMGLPFEKITSLPLPSDRFPEANKPVLFEGTTNQLFINEALEQRADLLASMKKQESSKILFEMATHNLKPEFDLCLNFGYTGLEEGLTGEDFVNSLTENQSDLNVSVLVQSEWPLGNSSARGELLQKQSQYEQYVIQINDLIRNISSGVTVAVNDLRSKIQELMKSGEAIRLYQTAVDNEKEKFKLGVSTLIDVITTQDRLESSLLNKISKQLGYAQGLVCLRFETGTLISPEEGEYSVNTEQLITIPSEKGGQQ